jgi:hypothetical protein
MAMVLPPPPIEGLGSGTNGGLGGGKTLAAAAVPGEMAAPAAGLKRGSMVPHFLQNRSVGSFSCLQATQRTISGMAERVSAGAGGAATAGARGVPQFLQNFAAGPFCVAHWGQAFAMGSLRHLVIWAARRCGRAGEC